MLTPDNVTLQEYNDALATEAVTHTRITFLLDNIVFLDEDIEQNGITVSTYMNPDDSMRFGTAVSTEAVIHLLRSQKTDEVNFTHEFTLEFGVDIEGETEWITVGHFTGLKPTQNLLDNAIELTAYDKMLRFDRDSIDFVNLLTFPCSLGDIYDELCSYIGVTKETGDEISDIMNRQVADASDFTFDNCRAILCAIAEANGCYARMTNDGKVQLKWFSDHTSDCSLVRDNCFGGTIMKLEVSHSAKWGSVSTLTWGSVSSVKYSEFDNEHNPTTYSHAKAEWNNQDGTKKEVIQPEIQRNDSGDTYTIYDNPFVRYSTDAAIKTHLQKILNRLELFHLYYVSNAQMVGNWLVETGDIVLLEISANNFVEFPIFNRVLRWNGACSCEYETTGSLAG